MPSRLAILFLAVLLASCDGSPNGRYQFVVVGEGVYRLDTRTGEVVSSYARVIPNDSKVITVLPSAAQ